MTAQQSQRADPGGPLTGVRVLEMGQLIAGPFAGQLLGDLGADVVKVEDPARGDPIRSWGRELPQGQSVWWSIIGRNKQSVTINLRSQEGQDLVRRLVTETDVLIENFRPGTLEKWGLGYDVLSEINPGIIMVRVSGYGQDGPYAGRPGYGAIGEAMGGLRYVVGDPSTPPSRTGISIGDTLAAMFAAIGALAALQERHVTGRGQVVDSAIYEAVLGVMESLVPEWTSSGFQRERTGAILPKIAPSNVYPTRDDGWILIAANQDTVFRRLSEALGAPELAEDERYATHVARGEHQVELDTLIADFTRSRSLEEMETLLNDYGVPNGRIYRPRDMVQDAQFLARESITSIAHPVLGSVAMQNVFPRLSRTRGRVRWPGPRLGEHTDEVLRRIGLTDDQVTALHEAGVV
ncbi:CaiB/BaiF CoA transferase family protein [Ornithinimicrobium cavernae]|uniref:CaiB/BaiF CoA transferase family protein n=1 Tax=Ornithinimicrobium cavernae TaxID=2666047 RepID=UPI000D69873C|nr:CaiB/BaiF CoA-transferase family protein [Ornithinimicrobium cavernae]